MLSEKDVDFYKLKYSEFSNKRGVFLIIFETIARPKNLLIYQNTTLIARSTKSHSPKKNPNNRH